MANRGVHFAVTGSDVRKLKSLSGDTERRNYVSNVIEESWESNFATETDKSWPLIHSALQMSNPCSDELDRTQQGPASWAILGQHFLAFDEDGFIAHVRRWSVGWVALYLKGVSATEVQARLNELIAAHKCGNLSSDDAAYAAEWYPRMVDFYARASKAWRHVIFSVDF
jgi:hypothetical protein